MTAKRIHTSHAERVQKKRQTQWVILKMDSLLFLRRAQHFFHTSDFCYLQGIWNVPWLKMDRGLMSKQWWDIKKDSCGENETRREGKMARTSAGRAGGGRAGETDGWRQSEHIFAEVLTALIPDEEVRLIRFVWNGGLYRGACHRENKSQSSHALFFHLKEPPLILLSPLYSTPRTLLKHPPGSMTDADTATDSNLSPHIYPLYFLHHTKMWRNQSNRNARDTLHNMNDPTGPLCCITPLPPPEWKLFLK